MAALVREGVDAVVAQAKTGSSTIADALTRAGVAPLVRTHTLRRGLLQERERRYRHDPRQLLHIHAALGMVERRPSPTRPWRVVTAVRDPIGRWLSGYFQAISAFDGPGLGPSATWMLDDIHAQFARMATTDNEFGLDWFDVNIKAITGVDVYDQPFDPAAATMTVDGDWCRVVVLRTEDLDQRGAVALAGLFELDGPPDLGAVNVAAQKAYADLYAAVRDEFRPAEEHVRAVYRRRLARHFYSEEEVERFTRGWLG